MAERMFGSMDGWDKKDEADLRRDQQREQAQAMAGRIESQISVCSCGQSKEGHKNDNGCRRVWVKRMTRTGWDDIGGQRCCDNGKFGEMHDCQKRNGDAVTDVTDGGRLLAPAVDGGLVERIEATNGERPEPGHQWCVQHGRYHEPLQGEYEFEMELVFSVTGYGKAQHQERMRAELEKAIRVSLSLPEDQEEVRLSVRSIVAAGKPEPDCTVVII